MATASKTPGERLESKRQNVSSALRRMSKGVFPTKSRAGVSGFA